MNFVSFTFGVHSSCCANHHHHRSFIFPGLWQVAPSSIFSSSPFHFSLYLLFFPLPSSSLRIYSRLSLSWCNKGMTSVCVWMSYLVKMVTSAWTYGKLDKRHKEKKMDFSFQFFPRFAVCYHFSLVFIFITSTASHRQARIHAHDSAGSLSKNNNKLTQHGKHEVKTIFTRKRRNHCRISKTKHTNIPRKVNDKAKRNEWMQRLKEDEETRKKGES